MTQRIKDPGEAATTPARIFRRTRTALPPALSSASCWTAGRLSNAPVMVGNMCAAASDDIFAKIADVVEAERARRSRCKI